MSSLPLELIVDEEPVPVPAVPDSLRDLVAELIRRRARAVVATEESQREADRARRSLYLSLLRVLDAFDRLDRTVDIAALDDTARQRLRSVRLTASMLEDVLDQEDVTPMADSKGKLVDPRFHEVAEVQNRRDRPDGTILEVSERGFEWQGRLLRRAKVVISKRA